jgi:hypothetical protein
MEKFIIEIEQTDRKDAFEVIDYAHDDDNRCKFELFKDEVMVASFEPDKYGVLNICKNPGNIDRSTLHLIAEKIESYNFH